MGEMEGACGEARAAPKEARGSLAAARADLADVLRGQGGGKDRLDAMIRCDAHSRERQGPFAARGPPAVTWQKGGALG